MMTAVQRYVSLAAALAVLVTASVALAIGGDEEEASALRTPAPDTGEVQAPPADDAPQAPDAEAPTAPSPVDGQQAPPDATAPDTSPGPTVPPQAGTYTYRETSDGETRESTVRVVDRGEGRQEEVRGDVRLAVAWRDDGKFVERTTFGASGGFECDWDPPLRELALPLSDGGTWQIEGTCDVMPGVTFEFSGNATVVGTQTLEVGGVSVLTWKLDSHVTTVFQSPEGSFEQELDSESWFAPSHGLYIRAIDVVEGPDPQTGRSSTRTTERELVSLEPS